MKTLKYILLVALFAKLFSCTSSEKQSELPVIDVTKSYPKKEIVLQDIAEVEYIPLETNDSVLLNKGNAVLPISEDKILMYNFRDGDIFLFNSNGKFLKRINHKGQSGEEYLYLSKVVPDDKNKELFVFDTDQTRQNRIQVYSFDGEYKRTLYYPDDLNIEQCLNFNDAELLCYHTRKFNFGKEEQAPNEAKLLFLSKETGTVNTTIDIPVKEDVDAVSSFGNEQRRGFIIARPDVFVNYSDGIIINEIACDTIYTLSKDKLLHPMIVRTPAVSSAEAPLKMLGVTAIGSDSYYYKIMLKEFNVEKNISFPSTFYQMQKDNGEVIEYTLKNADVVENKKEISLNEFLPLSVDDLKELLEENKLKGELKRIAETLDDDANPVLMRIQLK